MDRLTALTIARLAACYRQGRLVPFLGAGMSVPACPGWEEFVEGLEEQVFGVVAPAKKRGKSDTEALIRRANAAVRQIRLSGEPQLGDAVLKSLKARGAAGTPAQTLGLARLFWPLVLTSNYDDLFFKAWNAKHEHTGSSMQVLGRSQADCRDVLTSLHSSRSPILWALQGYVGESVGSSLRQFRRAAVIQYGKGGGFGNEATRLVRRSFDAKLAQLRSQLVVGHEEYRRVAYTEPQFRRAFAEVFRSRSLLFLGCSLADQYLLNLFGETLEVFGSNPYPHYALVLKGSTDPDFLRSRLNTFVYEYKDHGDLPGLLNDLHDAVESESARVRTWSYSVKQSPRSSGARKAVDLHIVRGELPTPHDRECVALGVTVAKTGKVNLPRAEAAIVEKMQCTGSVSKMTWPGSSLVQRVGGHPLFLCRVESQAGEQDVREYSRAITALLQTVDGAEFRVIRTRLPLPDRHHQSSGVLRIGQELKRLVDKATGGLSRLLEREFLQRYWLMESIRAYGAWRRLPGNKGQLELAVHLSDPGILFDMATGRIDPIELLMCDDVRFTVEIADETDALLSESYQCESTVTLGALADRLRVLKTVGASKAPDLWFVEVDPSPTGLPQVTRLSDGTAIAKSLSELGVLTDSVLRFVRVAAQPAVDAATQKGATTPKSAITPKGATTPKRSTGPAQG